MSYIEHVEDVTLHKLVDSAWQTEPETARMDVLHDSAQNLFYVVAQTPSGKFPIRTYITEDVTEQYVAGEEQFHTWWIPDEENNLQAWSLMYNTKEDATKLYRAIMKAAAGNIWPEPEATAGAAEAPSESLEGYPRVKKEFIARRKDLFQTFKSDLSTGKHDILAELKKYDQTRSFATSSLPLGSHISLHLKLGLQPGKTMADLQALYDKEVAVVMQQPGCLHFQIQMTEESLANKTAILTEKYASAEAHLATNKALMEAGLVTGENGIFATYDFVEMKFGLPPAELSNDYKGLLAQFEQVTGHAPVVILHDFGGWVNKTGKAAALDTSEHVVLTATCGLKPGKTLADMKELYEKEVKVARSVPGCLHFQLEMNEDTAQSKTAVLHEMYTSADGHLELNKALDAAGLVEGIFATYDFQEMSFGVCNTPVTEAYQGLLGQFEQVTGHKPLVDETSCTGKIRKTGGR